MRARLKVELKFYNPNPVIATLDRLMYSLYGNDIYLGDGIIPEVYDIPPQGTRTITTHFELPYGGAVRAIWDYLIKGGRITWRIVGIAYIDTPLGTLNIPFDVKK